MSSLHVEPPRIKIDWIRVKQWGAIAILVLMFTAVVKACA